MELGSFKMPSLKDVLQSEEKYQRKDIEEVKMGEEFENSQDEGEALQEVMNYNKQIDSELGNLVAETQVFRC